MSNWRFERDAKTAGFAACFRAPQAKRWASCHTSIWSHLLDTIVKRCIPILLALCGFLAHAQDISIDGFSSETFAKYSPGEILEVKLSEGDSSKRLDFPTGASLFQGITLSESTNKSLLEIVTKKRGWWLPTADILVPSFLFLDRDFHKLGNTEPVLYQFTGKFNDSEDNAFYGATYIPQNTKYVITYIDISKRDKTVRHLMSDSPSATRLVKEIRNAQINIEPSQYADGKVPVLNIWQGFSVHEIGRRTNGDFKIRISP